MGNKTTMKHEKTTDQKPFPVILKIIQGSNYVVLVIALMAACLYGFLPINDEILLIEGQKPLNQFAASMLWVVQAVLIAVAIYFIRMRKSIAPTIFTITILISYPLGEMLGYFMNDPLTNMEILIYFPIDLLIVTYMLKSKRVREVLNQK